MPDRATVLITIFTIVDNVITGQRVIQEILDSSGPASRLSDSEVVTIALYLSMMLMYIHSRSWSEDESGRSLIYSGF
jgi:hypothetical protein